MLRRRALCFAAAAGVAESASHAVHSADRPHTRLLCWGQLPGQPRPTKPTELVLSGLPPREDNSIWDFVAVGSGLNHFALLTSAGEIVLVGNNNKGQVGQPSSGVEIAENIPYAYDVGYEEADRPDSIACGTNFSILFKKGTRHATVIGYNLYGQLGLGHKQILDNRHGFAEWDPAAPWFREGEVVNDVVCGKNHTLILTSHGRVLGCGSNHWGELGIEDDTSSPMQPSPVRHFVADSEEEPRDAPQGSCRIQRAAGGGAFSVLLAKSGHVYACGSDEFGQIGRRDFVPKMQFLQRVGSDALMRIKNVGCCVDMACYITRKNELFVRGGIPEIGQVDSRNRLRMIEFDENVKGKKITTLTCGATCGYVVAADGAISGFGNNTEGQVAISSGKINTAPTAYMETTAPVLPPPSSLSGIDWRRHFAVGHAWSLLIDRGEAFRARSKEPVHLPPQAAEPRRRRLKFW